MRGGSTNPYPYANSRPSDLGQHLRQVFNLGQAPITQRPGAAHPTTRQFYSTHQGYDYGTQAGTPIRPNVSGRVIQAAAGHNEGWGNRALVQLDNGESYFLNHLAKIPQSGITFKAGDVIGLTGGIPGMRGSGNSTGAHLDITPAGKNAFSNLVRGIQQGAGTVRRKIDLASAYKQAQQKYGAGVKAVSTNPTKLASLAKNFKNAKIIRL